MPKTINRKKGLDYFVIYSPVTRITSIRMLVAIAALHKNVKTTFLNCDVDEEIYMEQPEWIIVRGQEKKMCKLVKSLYGLKLKQCHLKFDKAIMSNGFKINEC